MVDNVEIVAECGSNHNGNLQRALDLITLAAYRGADTAKFQLFDNHLWRKDDPRSITTKSLALPAEWIPKLQIHCQLNGVNFLCTPFSIEALKILEFYDVKRYKIASGDITYKPLISLIGGLCKPIILSTGFSTMLEIDQALNWLNQRGPNPKITLLHCVGGYPTLPADANLFRIQSLKEEFGLPVGVSSHYKQWWLDVAAVMLGAVMIEKHFDLYEGKDVGVEGGHSLLPSELSDLVNAVEDVRLALTTPEREGFCKVDQDARQNARRDPSDWLRPYLGDL